MKTIYLIRHAPVDEGIHEPHLFKGIIDVPLSASGETAAAELASKFKGITLDRVYCGPLLRVRRTAELIVRESRSDQAVVTDRLNDINCGVWEGMKVSDVIEKFPMEFEKWRKFPADFTFPDGESVSEVASRAHEFFNEVVSGGGIETIAFVTHRLVINAIILNALGIGLDKFWSFRYDTCSISKLFIEKGIYTVGKLNADLP